MTCNDTISEISPNVDPFQNGSAQTPRKSFLFYESWLAAVKYLPKSKQAAAFMAIAEYALTGELPEDLPDMVRAILVLIIPQIEANNQKYINGMKGAESGKLGGRPKKTATDKKPAASKKAGNKKTPTKPLENPYMINEECEMINEKREMKNENVSSSSSSALPSEEANRGKEAEEDEEEKRKEIDNFLKLRREIEECKKRPVWRESIRKKFRIEDDLSIDSYLEEFFIDAQCRDLKIQNISSYFTAWLEKHLEAKKKEAEKSKLNQTGNYYNPQKSLYASQPNYTPNGGLSSRLPLTPGHGLRL